MLYGRMTLSPTPRLLRAIVGAICLGLLFPLQAQEDDDYTGYTPAQEQEGWQEDKIIVPAFPQKKDLLTISTPAQRSMRLFLDTRSLTLGKDFVTRLTYVIETQSGARNVFYEGIRCSTRQYKTYAIGDDKQEFIVQNNAQWHDLPYHEDQTLRYTLFKHYLCDKTAIPKTPKEIVRAIRMPTDSD